MAKLSRRNVLLGLGTAAAGSGIVFGSGAFTQVDADRDLELGINNDSDALISLTANEDEGSVQENDADGTLEVVSDNISEGSEGFNVDAIVTFGDADFDSGGVTTPAFTIENNLDSGAATSEVDITVEVSAGSDFDGTLTLALDDDDGTQTTISISDDDSEDTGDDFEGLSADGADDGGTIDVAIQLDTDAEDSPDSLNDGEISVTAERDEGE